MSYRSDVSLVMTRNLFGKMLRAIPRASREMISCSDKFEASGDSILVFWNGVKWYTESTAINQIHHFLNDWKKLPEREWEDFRSQYHFIRVGSDSYDIEQYGTYWDNPWLTTVVKYINVTGKGESIHLDSFF